MQRGPLKMNKITTMECKCYETIFSQLCKMKSTPNIFSRCTSVPWQSGWTTLIRRKAAFNQCWHYSPWHTRSCGVSKSTNCPVLNHFGVFVGFKELSLKNVFSDWLPAWWDTAMPIRVPRDARKMWLLHEGWPGNNRGRCRDINRNHSAFFLF